MSTSVNSVVNHFPSAENGFATTTSSSTNSGAVTVELASLAGYANGEVVVFVIEPTSVSGKQTFTGVVDISGSQITSVVWTAGSNQVHNAGVVVVDFATATHISMISKGLAVSHDQDGTLKAGAVDNAAVLANNVVTSSKIASLAVNTTAISNPYKFSAYRAAAHTPGLLGVIQFDTELFDTNNNFDVTTNKGRYTAPVAGFYQFNANLLFTTASVNQDTGISFAKNGTIINRGVSAVNMYAGVTGAGVTASCMLQLAASDYITVIAQATLPLSISSAANNTFTGFLVSQT